MEESTLMSLLEFQYITLIFPQSLDTVVDYFTSSSLC